MRSLALIVWAVILLLAFAGPLLILFYVVMFVVGAIVAFFKPEWLGIKKR